MISSNEEHNGHMNGEAPVAIVLSSRICLVVQEEQR
jgi:hypothetical protein